MDFSPQTADNAALIRHIQDTELAELGPVLRELMLKVSGWREQHRGFVPLEVFPLVLGIAGQYTSLEYAIRIVDAGELHGYLLRKRGSDEQGWEGEYHIPGVAIVNKPRNEVMAAAQARVEKEIPFIDWNAHRARLVPIGLEAHEEPQRNCTCISLIMCLDLTPQEYSRLIIPAGWALVQPQNSAETIIEHHRHTMQWIERPGRQAFELVDLRGD